MTENSEGHPSFGQIVIHTPVQLVADVSIKQLLTEIPVSSVAAERGFSFQNKIKPAMRGCLSDRRTQSLMTIASAAITLDASDYTSERAV